MLSRRLSSRRRTSHHPRNLRLKYGRVFDGQHVFTDFVKSIQKKIVNARRDEGTCPVNFGHCWIKGLGLRRPFACCWPNTVKPPRVPIFSIYPRYGEAPDLGADDRVGDARGIVVLYVLADAAQLVHKRHADPSEMLGVADS